jgi:hypothetical protein
MPVLGRAASLPGSGRPASPRFATREHGLRFPGFENLAHAGARGTSKPSSIAEPRLIPMPMTSWFRRTRSSRRNRK